jgi:hypothetical protein
MFKKAIVSRRSRWEPGAGGERVEAQPVPMALQPGLVNTVQPGKLADQTRPDPTVSLAPQ